MLITHVADETLTLMKMFVLCLYVSYLLRVYEVMAVLVVLTVLLAGKLRELPGRCISIEIISISEY